MGQVRQEIDRRLQEKEEEFNNARKVHQKTAEQMQAHLESECKAKAEVLRTKKKLEADIQVILCCVPGNLHKENCVVSRKRTGLKIEFFVYPRFPLVVKPCDSVC